MFLALGLMLWVQHQLIHVNHAPKDIHVVVVIPSHPATYVQQLIIVLRARMLHLWYVRKATTVLLVPSSQFLVVLVPTRINKAKARVKGMFSF